MGWMIEFIGAVFITSVTGGLITVVWALIGKILDKIGFVNILLILSSGFLLKNQDFSQINLSV